MRRKKKKKKQLRRKARGLIEDGLSWGKTRTEHVYIDPQLRTDDSVVDEINIAHVSTTRQARLNVAAAAGGQGESATFGCVQVEVKEVPSTFRCPAEYC
jgi:hypothetical protein